MSVDGIELIGEERSNMVKKSTPFKIIIYKFFSSRMSYNIITGNIQLPHFNKPVIEERLKWNIFIISFTHEFMHKWLHENVSFNACLKWDNIDVNRKIENCPISALLFT